MTSTQPTFVYREPPLWQVNSNYGNAFTYVTYGYNVNSLVAFDNQDLT